MGIYWCPKKTPFTSVVFRPKEPSQARKRCPWVQIMTNYCKKHFWLPSWTMIFKALHPIHSPLDYWAEGFPLSRQKAKTHENRPQHQLTESRFVTTSPQEYCIYSIECVCVCFWVNNKINRVCLTLFSTNLHLLASGVQNHKWVFFCPTLYLRIRRQKTKKV